MAKTAPPINAHPLHTTRTLTKWLVEKRLHLRGPAEAYVRRQAKAAGFSDVELDTCLGPALRQARVDTWVDLVGVSKGRAE